ncbi:MAG: hypothetical protein ACI9YL_001641 [Luteibaculaceae bacterium]|jgi:hypothetical protein
MKNIALSLLALFFLYQANSQTIVFEDDFESSAMGAEWISLTPPAPPAMVNQWVINSNGCNGMTTQVLHVSNASGDCAYRKQMETSNIIVYAAVDGTGFSGMTLSFDYTCEGEGIFDYGMVVYSVDGVNFVPFATGGSADNGIYEGDSIRTNQTLPIPAELDSLLFYIGFKWLNEPSGGGGTPFSIDDVKVTTSVGGAYCPASGPTCGTLCMESGLNCGDSLNTWVKNVQFANVFNPDSGCGNPTKGYSDWTSFVGNVEAGGNYVFSLEAEGIISPSDPMICQVYVDWNDDKIFEDTEMFTPSSVDAITFTGPMSVPITAVLNTNLRLRIRFFFSLSAPQGPCGATNYGEVEDYTILVGEPGSSECPQSHYPSDNQINLCTDEVLLRWDSIESIQEYVLSVGSNTNGYNNKVNNTVLTDTSYLVAQLDPATTYKWIVRTINELGDTSSVCDTVQFTTGPGNPVVGMNNNPDYTCLSNTVEFHSNIAGGQINGQGNYPNLSWLSSPSGIILGPANDSSVVVSPNATGSFSLYFNATDSLGCTVSDSLTVDVLKDVFFELNPASSIELCLGEEFEVEVFNIEAARDYAFQFTPFNGSFVVDGSGEAGMYSNGSVGIDSLEVVLSMGGCEYRDSAFFNTRKLENPTVNITSNPDFGNGGSTCYGSPVQFSLTGDFLGDDPSIFWRFNGVVNNTYLDQALINTSALNDGDNVDVKVVSDYQCLSSTTVQSNIINVDLQPEQIPFISMEVVDVDLCSDHQVVAQISDMLFLNNPEGYEWSIDGAIYSTPDETVFTFPAEDYTGAHTLAVRVGKKNNCGFVYYTPSNTVDFLVTEVLEWEPAIFGPEKWCNGRAVNLEANYPSYLDFGNVFRTWYLDGDVISSQAEIDATTFESGQVVGLQIVSSLECARPNKSDLIEHTVEVLNNPKVSFDKGNYFEWCLGESLQIGAEISGGNPPYQNMEWRTPNGTILPSSGGVLQGVSTNIVGLQSFSFFVEDQAGCEGFAPVNYEIRKDPSVDYTTTQLVANRLQFTSIAPDATEWFWTFGDNLVAYVQNPVHTFEKSGTYDVCLTVLDRVGCENQRCKPVDVLIVGIDGSKISALDVFPNPNTGHFHIGGEHLKRALSIHDVVGRLLWKTTLGIGESDVKLPDSIKGTVILEIESDAGKQHNKMIIQ